MNPWLQNFNPTGSAVLSTIAAAIPVSTLFFFLAVLRKPAWLAAVYAFVAGLVVALFVFHMPAAMALGAVADGLVYGWFRIAWIVVAAVFIYEITVESKQFEIIKQSIGGISDDRRLQLLLIAFESFSVLSALAMATERVRLGHMVVCTGFRNPALTAKLSSTIDVISGGRFELGIGAGWKEEEWRAYGYGFPTIGERMAALGDHLEVIRAMLGPGRAFVEGRYAQVRGAINIPKGIQQPRIPIIVGGNGQRVTAGLAIRYADELNYVFLSPAEVAERIAAVRARCETEGRDPSTLRFSLYTRDEEMRNAGQERVDVLGELAGVALDRIVCFPTRWSPTVEAQVAFAEDCRAAGLQLMESVGV